MSHYLPRALNTLTNTKLKIAIASLNIAPTFAIMMGEVDEIINDVNFTLPHFTETMGVMAKSIMANSSRTERLEALVDIQVYNKNVHMLFEAHGESYAEISKVLPSSVLESLLFKLI